MSTDNVIPFVSKEDGIRILYSVVILSLARMIHSGAINPETITRKQFLDFLSELGTSHENALEVHVTRIEDEMRFIAYCIAAGEAKSGIVLLFTLLEGEINLLIRVHLRIQGFSPNAITDALRGTDFDTRFRMALH